LYVFVMLSCKKFVCGVQWRFVNVSSFVCENENIGGRINFLQIVGQIYWQLVLSSCLRKVSKVELKEAIC
jgi:hypothetical protein